MKDKACAQKQKQQRRIPEKKKPSIGLYKIANVPQAFIEVLRSQEIHNKRMNLSQS